MSLIHDIQAAAISQTTDVPTLLRMCKLLAARISHQQFAEWVDKELNGYPDVASMPDYRITQVESYGTFAGEFRQAPKLQIPVSVLPPELRERFRHAYMGASISAYSALLAGDTTGRIEEPWPLPVALHHATKVVNNMQCIAAWKEIPIGAVVRLLDSVKTRVLGYAIDLERAAPEAGDTPIGSQPPISGEKMTQIFNTNITGNVGNISNASSDFTQNANISVAGNWDALSQQLLALGLTHSDLIELKPELEQAANAPDLATKSTVASGWIGKLTGKVVTGASGVALEVASSAVAKAIAAYLGLPGA